MNPEVLLIIFVGVTAVALTLQSLAIWKTFRTVNRMAGQAEARLDRLERETDQIMAQVQSVAESFQPLVRVGEDLQGRGDELVRIIERRSADIDELIGELVDIGRRQAQKVDTAVSDTVDKFEEATDILQQDLIRPVVEISSFVKGMKTGLEYLLARRQRSAAPDERYPDEEMYI